MFKIKSIYIDNFKVFNNFTMEFNENLTVMIGLNGTGKTTILEIINNILNGNSKYFCTDNSFTYIKLIILQEKETKKIEVRNTSSEIVTLLDDKPVDDITKYLKYSKVLYVPTEVNFKNIELNGAEKIREEEKNIILDSNKMSKQLKQFLVNEKYRDLNDIAEGRKDKAIRLDKFKKLYNDFFEDKEFIGIDNNTFEPQFRIKETDKIIKIEDLSAGEKQIFFRGGSLLQNVEDCAIVLIDGPELGMHPKWQQKILDFYRNINRNSQYIISTHSPHIAICTLPNEIRVFDKSDGQIVVKNIECSYGRTVSETLTSIFDLKTLRNETIEKDIQEYRKLYFMDKEKTNEEKERLQELKEKLNYLNPNDPDIALIDFEKETNALKEKIFL